MDNLVVVGLIFEKEIGVDILRHHPGRPSYSQRSLVPCEVLVRFLSGRLAGRRRCGSAWFPSFLSEASLVSHWRIFCFWGWMTTCRSPMWIRLVLFSRLFSSTFKVGLGNRWVRSRWWCRPDLYTVHVCDRRRKPWGGSSCSRFVFGSVRTMALG
jgi:hypothetical protein